MKTTVKLFAGVEGGGTKTLLTIINEHGEVVSRERAGPSNPWNMAAKEDGFVLSARVLYNLIQQGLHSYLSSPSVSEDHEYSLEAACLCLSGLESEQSIYRLTKELRDLGANYQIFIGSDTLAPVFTAFDNGGIVIISGTGSNCTLINPIDQELHKLESLNQIASNRSGGWGNLLGDEGSAYWIALKAIKHVIDSNDNFFLDHSDVDSEEDDQDDVESENYNRRLLKAEINEIKEIMFEHFNIKSLQDILPHFYSDFKKDFIAGLTAKLAAHAENKTIIKSIFEEAGFQLARHVIAIQPRIDKSLLHAPNGLPIVCTGSVFKSWHLIKPGFIRCLKTQTPRKSTLNEINLVCINQDAAIGAAKLAAKLSDSNMSIDIQSSKLITQLDRLYVKQLKQLPQLNSGHINFFNGTTNQTTTTATSAGITTRDL